MNFLLQIVLQRGEHWLYRFRSQLEAKGWLQLHVVGE